MLGVIQEQHAERCRLFAQWQEFDWPILNDPINKLGLKAVPIVVEVDERGKTRSVNPTIEDFLASLPETRPSAANDRGQGQTNKPDIATLRQAARDENSYSAWTQLGDALVLWADQERATEAIEAYERAKQHDPNNAEIHFRLGVAHQFRHDASFRLKRDTSSGESAENPPASRPLASSHDRRERTNDFASAVHHWEAALDLEPNQYIYRRRIQQYGPRLIKPYPFYDWIAQARQEIAARGETPIELTVEPSGAEIASPEKEFVGSVENRRAPDPQGKINRDTRGIVRADVVVVPESIRPGESVRVHVQLQPTASACWNNENEPLVLWLEVPDGWQADRQWFESTMPRAAESSEVRTFEFEVKPVVSQVERTVLKSYALYYVCETNRGVCMYLRQDIAIPIDISSR